MGLTSRSVLLGKPRVKYMVEFDIMDPELHMNEVTKAFRGVVPFKLGDKVGKVVCDANNIGKITEVMLEVKGAIIVASKERITDSAVRRLKELLPSECRVE